MIRVSVVLALPHRQQCIALSVAAGTPARAAVLQAMGEGLDLTGSDLQAENAALAIHGRVVAGEQALRDGDRIDLLRPLQQDPMELRRKRGRSRSR